MDRLEIAGYLVLALVALIYLGVMLAGLIAAWPLGLLGLLVILGLGLLLLKVLRERLANAEDSHYSETVDQ